MPTWFVSFQRFFVSGFSAAILNFACYYVLNSVLGVDYLLSGVLAFLAAFIFAFYLHRNWSFVENRTQSAHKQVILYLCASSGNLVLVLFLLYALSTFLAIPHFVAYIIAAGSSALVSFIVNKQFVFNKGAEESEIWKMFFITALCAASFFIIHSISTSPEVSTDTTTYIQTAQYYGGEVATAPGFRLLKPLAPLSLAGIHKINNIPYLDAFIILNGITYCMLAFAALYFFYVFFDRNKTASYLGMLLVITSYPVLKYGLDPLTELGILFFVFMSATYAVAYNRNESTSSLITSLSFILVGFLWKEYTVLIGVALFLIVLSKTYKNVSKYAFHLLLVTLIPIVFLAIWTAITYALYDYTYLDWLKIGSSSEGAYSQFTVYYVGKSFFATLLLGWVYALIGLLYVKGMSAFQKKEVIVLTLALPAAFVWGYVSSRLFFPAILPFFILSVYGLLHIERRYGGRILVVCLILYALTDFLWSFTSKLFTLILGN
ncbi:MAG: hypothetical protein JWO50_249 [Candidatus Kaiserbacteria bacterium]|nr:hypothetical protein [Candidatus Kaiserbacteria bacterium]